MLNLLRSDPFRLVRSASFWVYAAIAVAIPLLAALLMTYIASPEFTMVVDDNMALQAETLSEGEDVAGSPDETPDESVEPLNSKVAPSLSYLWSNSFTNGGLLGILGSVFAALFLARDFKSGFVKNLPLDRRGRLRYHGEKLLFVAFIQAVFLALCAVSTAAWFAAFGFTFEVVESAADLALWLLIAWLMACAYAFIAACVVWLTRTEWAGACFGALVSSGVVGAFFIQLMLLLGRAHPVLDFVPYWIPAGVNAALSAGAGSLLTMNEAYPIPALLPAGSAILTCAIYIALGVIVTFAVCRKRDIG